jgi:hypothetical protein
MSNRKTSLLRILEVRCSKTNPETDYPAIITIFVSAWNYFTNASLHVSFSSFTIYLLFEAFSLKYG